MVGESLLGVLASDGLDECHGLTSIVDIDGESVQAYRRHDPGLALLGDLFSHDPGEPARLGVLNRPDRS